MLVKDDEALRVWKRQRPEEHRVDEREDRRRGANADGKRENRHGAERGVLTETAEGVDHILPKPVNHGEAADIAALLLSLIDGAHVTQRSRTRGGQGHSRGDV